MHYFLISGPEAGRIQSSFVRIPMALGAAVWVAFIN